MSDFFTHLAGQVIQPSTEVIPNIPLRFAPGAAVPASALAPEPPVLDTLFQPAQAVSADRIGADRSSPPLDDAPVIPKALAGGANLPNPAVFGTRSLPDLPKTDKDYPAAVKAPGVENAAPALASAPHETRPIALPAEGNELPRTPAGPSGAQPSPVDVPPVVLPLVRPAGRPEAPVGQPLSAGPAAGPKGPRATERLSIPIVRPAGSLSPLEPLEPPPGQPSSAAPGPDLAVPMPPAGSVSQPEPLASPQAGEIARPNQTKTDVKISTAAFQPQPLQRSQRAAANSLPEILPLVKPAAQTILPAISLSPTPSSPEMRHAAAEAAIPQVKAALPDAVISPQTPAVDSLESILAAPLSHVDPSRQPQSAPRAERAQAQPAQSPAVLRPAPIPAIDPGPMDAAEPVAPAAQRPPGASDPRPAPQPEIAAEQPLFTPELNPKSFIRPVLGADLPLDSTALSSRSGTDETAIPTVRLTIGRIVVKTASTTAPAASRPASIRRQPAISLHDYLNRHGGDQ